MTDHTRLSPWALSIPESCHPGLSRWAKLDDQSGPNEMSELNHTEVEVAVRSAFTARGGPEEINLQRLVVLNEAPSGIS